MEAVDKNLCQHEPHAKAGLKKKKEKEKEKKNNLRCYKRTVPIGTPDESPVYSNPACSVLAPIMGGQPYTKA